MANNVLHSFTHMCTSCFREYQYEVAAEENKSLLKETGHYYTVMFPNHAQMCKFCYQQTAFPMVMLNNVKILRAMAKEIAAMRKTINSLATLLPPT